MQSLVLLALGRDSGTFWKGLGVSVCSWSWAPASDVRCGWRRLRFPEARSGVCPRSVGMAFLPLPSLKRQETWEEQQACVISINIKQDKKWLFSNPRLFFLAIARHSSLCHRRGNADRRICVLLSHSSPQSVVPKWMEKAGESRSEPWINARPSSPNGSHFQITYSPSFVLRGKERKRKEVPMKEIEGEERRGGKREGRERTEGEDGGEKAGEEGEEGAWTQHRWARLQGTRASGALEHGVIPRTSVQQAQGPVSTGPLRALSGQVHASHVLPQGLASLAQRRPGRGPTAAGLPQFMGSCNPASELRAPCVRGRQS